MAEYIKKEDAFDVACAECEAGTFYDIPSKIEAIPPADVVERKHGKWLLDTVYPSGVKKFRCSICGYDRTVHERYEGVSRQNFCPNCGARMDSEGEDEKEM